MKNLKIEKLMDNMVDTKVYYILDRPRGCKSLLYNYILSRLYQLDITEDNLVDFINEMLDC